MDPYIIVEARLPNVDSKETQAKIFAKMVNKQIKKGYRPTGGVTIIPGDNFHLDFYQSMTLDK